MKVYNKASAIADWVTINLMHTKIARRGFTLIELLVVIAIIGIIASIAMVALSESREHSKNTARATQIREYQKSINFYYSDNGHYPRANATTASATACLGDYDPVDVVSGTCWQVGSTGIQERAWLVNALTPQYMSRMSIADTTVFGDSPQYVGMYYNYTDYGRSYQLYYFMKGNNKNCMVDDAVGSNVGGDTRCILTVLP